MSVKQKLLFFQCLELIGVYSHPLICPLLCPKVAAKKIHYCGKILGETDLTDFIGLFSCVLIDSWPY